MVLTVYHNRFRPHRGCTEAGIEAREVETKEIMAMTKDTELELKETEINSPLNCFLAQPVV